MKKRNSEKRKWKNWDVLLVNTAHKKVILQKPNIIHAEQRMIKKRKKRRVPQLRIGGSMTL
eukprot:10725669-Ditylum_brightwellii.AAC.1